MFWQLSHLLRHLFVVVHYQKVVLDGVDDICQYIVSGITQKIMSQFSKTKEDDLNNFAWSLINNSDNFGLFRQILHDFLIQLKKGDNQDYYREEMLESAQRELETVPGLSGPAEPEFFDSLNGIAEF